MPARSIRIARIAGIPVGVSPLWLVIVALITWSLGAGYYTQEVPGISSTWAYGLGLVSALLLFASILAHEFGHALVARRRGVQVEEIDLWLLGGLARMSGQPKTAADELAFALAGPGVTAVVAALFGALALVLPDSVPGAVRALIDYQAQVNLLILGFNLVPAFPLDGGRVARALMWRHSGDFHAATNTAAGLGRAFGLLLVGFGLLLGFVAVASGLWLAVIGVFLVFAANAERQHEEVVRRFIGIPAEELMSRPAISIAADCTLAQAHEYFLRYRYTAFPVTDASGRVLGMLSTRHLDGAPRAAWERASAGEQADRDPALVVAEGEDVAHLLEEPAFVRVGRAAVVDRDGRPVGVLSVTDLERAIRVSRLGDRTAGPGSLVSR